jgi:hypothetical protein
MSGARDWKADDRTGGALDHVFDQVRSQFPELAVEGLVMPWPADDDNVYWLHLGVPPPGLLPRGTIQVDTNMQGAPPFLLEGLRDDGEYLNTSDAEVAATTLIQWLERRRAHRTKAG